MGSFILFRHVWLLVIAPGIYVADARSLSGDEPKCKLFQFRDHGTGDCEECSEICDRAALARTEVQCREACRDYLEAQRCTPEAYFDEQVRDCRPCLELCQHHEIRGTTQQCQDRCPGFPRKENDTIPSSSQPTPHNHEGKTLFSGPTQPLVVVVVVVVVLAAVIVVTGMLFALAVYRTRSRVKYARASQTDGDSSRGAGAVNRQEERLQGNRHPEVETHPFQRSELAANPTGT